MKKTFLILLRSLLSVLILIIFSCNNSKKTPKKNNTPYSRELKAYSNPEQKILDDIELHQFNIAITSKDQYLPSYAHTIGLFKNYNHPEIIIFGLENENMHQILNTLVTKIQNGKDYEPGNNYTNIVPNSPIKLLPIKKEYYPDYFKYANWFYDNTFDFPAYQLVWADKNKKYPWDEAFNESIKFKQPLLNRNTDFKFLEKRNLGVFATQEILDRKPILWVHHNENGDWQFHNKENPDLDNALLVSLESIVKLDPSLNQLYELNYGQSATRKNIKSEWKIIDKTINN